MFFSVCPHVGLKDFKWALTTAVALGPRTAKVQTRDLNRSRQDTWLVDDHMGLYPIGDIIMIPLRDTTQ